MSPSDFEIIARTHARLSYSFLTQIFLQLYVLKKKYMKLGSEKLWVHHGLRLLLRHTRVSYSFSGPMVVHFEVVGQEWMSMNLEMVSNMFWDCRSDSRKSSILMSKIDDCSFWRGETEYESWKFYGYKEASMFWNCRSASSMAYILFSNSDFSSIDCSQKEVYEAWCWEIFEDCELSMFGNHCWDLSMASMTFILFSNS